MADLEQKAWELCGASAGVIFEALTAARAEGRAEGLAEAAGYLRGSAAGVIDNHLRRCYLGRADGIAALAKAGEKGGVGG